MSIVSHLHHLFNAETCQSYIHALRWKDRPLQCPRCQSHNVGPWGTYHYQPGLKRYRCKEKGCKRTFNDLTGTLLDGSKCSTMHWIVVVKSKRTSSYATLSPASQAWGLVEPRYAYNRLLL